MFPLSQVKWNRLLISFVSTPTGSLKETQRHKVYAPSIRGLRKRYAVRLCPCFFLDVKYECQAQSLSCSSKLMPSFSGTCRFQLKLDFALLDHISRMNDGVTHGWVRVFQILVCVRKDIEDGGRHVQRIAYSLQRVKYLQLWNLYVSLSW